MTAYPRPFLFCVGAQKAGTTWLSRVLAEQTPVWVDPTKEMHFFDRYSDLPEIRAAADTRHHRRLVQAVSDLAALREAGADVDATNADGLTALEIARAQGRGDVVAEFEAPVPVG